MAGRGTFLAALMCVAGLVVASPVIASSGRYRLQDVTRDVGLRTDRVGSWSNLWADHDGNGWPDIFVGRHGAAPLFFLNSEGTYRAARFDLVSPPGYDPVDDRYVDRHSCAWGEATGDGRPDLYCTVGANEGTSVGPNQLLVRTPDGFRDVAKRYAVRDIYGRGRSVNWLDFDTDGDLDLYVGNWARAGHPSAVFENVRGRFRRVSVGVESDDLRTISSSWSDWDRDGDPDLLVMQYTAATIAYENRGGRFVATSIPRITDESWHSATWGDFDGNGYSDVHLLNESRSLVLRNGGRGFRVEDSRPAAQGRSSAWLDVENDGDLDLFVVRGAAARFATGPSVNRGDFLLIRRRDDFVRVRGRAFRGPRVGNGDSVTVADHDRDGRLDVFVTNGYYEYDQWQGRLNLFRNRSQARNWAAVDLVGGRWNPWGIGARLRVTAGDLSYRREVTDGVAFRSQSEVSHMHLGIGSEVSALVRVTWPNGTNDCVVVAAGMSQRVERGSHPCV